MTAEKQWWNIGDDLLRHYRDLHLIGMTGIEEHAFAHSYAQYGFTGCGEILDLGCWLGSLTVPLAKGLSENVSPSARERFIHSYDLFIWQQWMEDIAPAINKALVGRFEIGESFEPEFRNIIKQWKSCVKVYEGSVLDRKWSGEPVEFMYVDAMKDWTLTCGIHNTFFRYLLPNGYVAHQDFAFHGVPWLHLYAYRLRDYLVPVHHVSSSFTVLFRLQKPLDRAVMSLEWSYTDFSIEEIDAAFAWAATAVGPEKKMAIAVAKVICMLKIGRTDRARKAIDEIKRTFYVEDPLSVSALEEIERNISV